MKKFVWVVFIFSSLFSYSQNVHHWETAVFSGDSWKYFIGNSEPNAFWRINGYDDKSWLTGRGGFGYGDDDDTTLIAQCYAVYLRKEFLVSDTAEIAAAILNIDYDDGFVAYINGFEIARSGVVGAYPSYNTGAADHEAKVYAGGQYENFIVNKSLLLKCLTNGMNMLAIQVHNSSLGSSDLTAIPFLSFGVTKDKKLYRPVPAWFMPPATGNSFASTLPIISIQTYGQAIQDGIKINALMRVIAKSSGLNNLSDSANNYYGIIGIEIRGATSSGFPQKSFNVETRGAQDISRNVSLLGMPEENDWALIGNYNDKTLVRNTFSYALFTKMGRYAPRTRYCEVLINNEYQGIYMLTEKIKRDKNRVDIKKFDDVATGGDAITGGYIFKNDNKDADETSFLSNYSERGIPGIQEVPFIYVYPKTEELTNAHKTYLPSFINSFENVLYGPQFTHPVNGYKKYIEVNSFVDYFLLGEVSRSVDAYKKSKFYFKDVDKNGGLIHSGPPWDFDWAYKNIPEGNNQFECYYGNTDGSGWAYKVYLCNHSPRFAGWVPRLMQDPVFVNAVKTRYVSLRNSVLSNTSVNQMIDSLRSSLQEATGRHFQKWDILGKATNGSPEVDNQPATYDAAINQIKNWLRIRLEWLDKNMPGTVTSVQAISGQGIRIFPNPASDLIFIESKKKITRIQFYNSLGQLKYDAKYNASSITIPCPAFEKGIYLCKIYSPNSFPHATQVMMY